MTLKRSNRTIEILLAFIIVTVSWIFFAHRNCPHYTHAAFKSYEKTKALFSLIDPFELPKDGLLTDLEDFKNCSCPRVYYPACGNNSVTYFNACILKCLKKTKLQRSGPCIIYRRRESYSLRMSIPKKWKYSNLTQTIDANETLSEVVITVPGVQNNSIYN